MLIDPRVLRDLETISYLLNIHPPNQLSLKKTYNAVSTPRILTPVTSFATAFLYPFSSIVLKRWKRRQLQDL